MGNYEPGKHAGSIADRYISSLEPFHHQNVKEGGKGADELTNEILSFLNVADHFQDKRVGEIAQWYIQHKLGRYRHPVNRSEFHQVPFELIEDYSKGIQDRLASQHKYAVAYQIAKYMSYVSKAIGVMLVSGTGRNLMKRISEPRPSEGIELDPVDKLQIFDFMVKGVLLGAYMIVRTAPDHSPEEIAKIKAMHGFDYAKYLMQEIPHAALNAIEEPFKNRHNMHLVGGFFMLEGVANIPGYLLTRGRPVAELEKVLGYMGKNLEENAHHVMEDVSSGAQGITDFLSNKVKLPSAHREEKNNLAEIVQGLTKGTDLSGLAKAANQTLQAGFDTIQGERGEKVLNKLSDGKSKFSAQYGQTRDLYTNLILRGEAAEKNKSDMVTIAGGILEVVSATIDTLGVYRSLAWGDMAEDAAKIVGQNFDFSKYEDAA